NEANRRAYRNMLLTTKGLEQFVSGVILFDETLRQCALDDQETPFPKHLADKGILPGIKVDAGARDLAGFPGETV
ncbi:MAG TPA: fructose-bisphosphate aldolase class I, partial [Candidatus Latescibacteria bacterium]|nr:fructose-bisphosphate aldolase class I [Candidatus Latescibacterota bacterium]